MLHCVFAVSRKEKVDKLHFNTTIYIYTGCWGWSVLAFSGIRGTVGFGFSGLFDLGARIALLFFLYVCVFRFRRLGAHCAFYFAAAGQLDDGHGGLLVIFVRNL